MTGTRRPQSATSCAVLVKNQGGKSVCVLQQVVKVDPYAMFALLQRDANMHTHIYIYI